jgi:hypothetical protein
MTAKAISPLHRRLIEDMMIRRLSPKTQGDPPASTRFLTEAWPVGLRFVCGHWLQPGMATQANSLPGTDGVTLETRLTTLRR